MFTDLIAKLEAADWRHDSVGWFTDLAPEDPDVDDSGVRARIKHANAAGVCLEIQTWRTWGPNGRWSRKCGWESSWTPDPEVSAALLDLWKRVYSKAVNAKAAGILRRLG